MVHILLAESDSALQRLVGEVLTFSGYRVTAVADGRAALDHLQTGDDLPDLILSDLVMEPVNGVELLDAVRSEGGWRDIPFLMMSGDDRLVSLWLELTPTLEGYITKPFAIKDLLASIQHALANSQLNPSAQQHGGEDDSTHRLA